MNEVRTLIALETYFQNRSVTIDKQVLKKEDVLRFREKILKSTAYGPATQMMFLLAKLIASDKRYGPEVDEADVLRSFIQGSTQPDALQALTNVMKVCFRDPFIHELITGSIAVNSKKLLKRMQEVARTPRAVYNISYIMGTPSSTPVFLRRVPMPTWPTNAPKKPEKP